MPREKTGVVVFPVVGVVLVVVEFASALLLLSLAQAGGYVFGPHDPFIGSI